MLSTSAVEAMIELASRVPVVPAIHDYIVRLYDASRQLPEVRLGVSARGAVAMMLSVRALALSQGRDFVNADDVKVVARSVMSHRLLLTPESELRRIEPDDLVSALVQAVDVPGVVRS
ncbi:MAG: MoxR family ATPase [Acidimicrobiales bacterium]